MSNLDEKEKKRQFLNIEYFMCFKYRFVPNKDFYLLIALVKFSVPKLIRSFYIINEINIVCS